MLVIFSERRKVGTSGRKIHNACKKLKKQSAASAAVPQRNW